MENVELITLCLAGFLAGFVDSVVGGWGLIQLPGLMLILPAQRGSFAGSEACALKG